MAKHYHCCRMGTLKALVIEPLYMREPNPTEPANYRGSYTAASKELVDIEIAMCRNSGIVITDTITIGLGTMVTTTIELLLKLTVSGEEGGLRN
jgi:hypothetical protein